MNFIEILIKYIIKRVEFISSFLKWFLRTYFVYFSLKMLIIKREKNNS